jgi:hypothetical protein
MAEFEYPHIGGAIGIRLADLHMTKKDLGDEIGMSQSNIVYLTKRKSIDVITLHKISVALRNNFFKHYPVEEIITALPVDEKDKIIAELKGKIEEVERQADILKQENGYLKKINELLEKGLK